MSWKGTVVWAAAVAVAFGVGIAIGSSGTATTKTAATVAPAACKSAIRDAHRLFISAGEAVVLIGSMTALIPKAATAGARGDYAAIDRSTTEIRVNNAVVNSVTRDVKAARARFDADAAGCGGS